jgi:D-amino-acid oxidase
MTSVVVLGAGVIGLTVALELKKTHPDYEITIVGHHLPGDLSIEYTSPFAGANWHSFAERDDLRLQDIDTSGYKKFMELSKSDPRLGIWQVPNYNYFISQPIDETKPWFHNMVEDYAELNGKELPAGIKSGFVFNGVIITVPIYLQYLLSLNLEAGNTIKRIPKIAHIDQARSLCENGKIADYVINCSGILAGELQGVNDSSRNYPVRGQVLLVRNHSKASIGVEGFPNLDDELLYIMPRKEGGSIIGGCFQHNSTDPNVDDALTKRIIERAIKYAPELIDPNYKNNPTSIDIVRVNVGLRPFREGGPRIEIDSKKPWLIHGYGAGGGGYQGSYGFSERIIRLLETSNRTKL